MDGIATNDPTDLKEALPIFFATPAWLNRVVQFLVLLQQEPRPNVQHGHPNINNVAATQPGTACNRSTICNPSSKDHQVPLPCSSACPACLLHHGHHLTGQVGAWPCDLLRIYGRKAVITHPGGDLQYLVQLASISKTFHVAVTPILWSHLDWTTTHGERVDRRFVSWLEGYLTAHARIRNGGVNSTTVTSSQTRAGGGSSAQLMGAGGYVNVLQMSRSLWSLLHRGAFEALGQAFPNITVLELLEDTVNPEEIVQSDRKEVIFGAMNAQAQDWSGDADSLVDLLSVGLSLSNRIRLNSDQTGGFYRPRLEDLALSFPQLKSLILPEGGLNMVACSSSKETLGDKRKQGEVGQFRKRIRTDAYQALTSSRRCPVPRAWSSTPAATGRGSGLRQRSPLSMAVFAEEMDLMFPDPLDDDGQVRFGQLQHVSCTLDPLSLDNLDRILSDLCVSSLTKVEVRVRPMTLLWLVTTVDVHQGTSHGEKDGAEGGSYLMLCIRKVHRTLGADCRKKLTSISIPNLDALAKFGFDMDTDDGNTAAGVCRPEEKEKSYGDLVPEKICLCHCEDLKDALYLQPDPLDIYPQFFFV
ncbi:hypothetical protein BG015_004713 [Linnemannia schmuckeri]|uniref:Uncharacterized protein n=1 Tax=Linnemannia schmuckeri TaxID=64567 RepID=A0A9P5VFI0_9FUNG|nr:hypothetical protein BG015_004713 [Linnemannia schmuckeri]